MSKSKFQMVKEFNEQVVNLQGVRLAKCLAPQRVEWFKNVLAEEAQEFEDARIKKDCTAMLDALVDATYFILGRVQECGFTEQQWDKAFSYVHNCNMQKKPGNKGRGSDMDAVKDAAWQGPEGLIEAMLNETGYYRNIKPQDDTLDYKPKHQMTEKEINNTVYGTKAEKLVSVFDAPNTNIEEEVAPISCDENAIRGVTPHKPSIYIDDDGKQLICTVEDLKLFEKMSPVFKEVTKIAIKKSEDYNNGNGQPASRAQYFPFGLLSYAQMLHTKSQRLNSLAQQDKTPNNESIRDTLLDMINYATFAVEAIDKGEV